MGRTKSKEVFTDYYKDQLYDEIITLFRAVSCFKTHSVVLVGVHQEGQTSSP